MTKRDRSVLHWTRKLKKAKGTEDIKELIARMNPPRNCSHEAYITCIALAAVYYTDRLREEENGLES